MCRDGSLGGVTKHLGDRLSGSPARGDQRRQREDAADDQRGHDKTRSSPERSLRSEGGTDAELQLRGDESCETPADERGGNTEREVLEKQRGRHLPRRASDRAEKPHLASPLDKPSRH